MNVQRKVLAKLQVRHESISVTISQARLRCGGGHASALPFALAAILSMHSLLAQSSTLYVPACLSSWAFLPSPEPL